ncbi:ABC transporter ATP-binding protein [Helicobacter sp. 12S02634-8]|uniref:ribosomal protection-like ABC-F family protein n=1 Tax=Helicobacter sp. 12S02634-8 TaxID=1476199 RepID=UPI000BA58081|nr:ABC-F family ATP-binding cassette domain-containing protein [Helicobacter sp. 12S02634-8]PAF48552.1 ABC transporter ATP-binding protein [Helicobacter sp. 12S02634-8]
MALVSLLNISKQYDYKVILKDVNFSICKGEKIAIVGKNGSGKTTLVQILTGQIEQDVGERITQNNLKILSLAQNPVFEPLMSVREVCEESLSELKNAHKRLEAINLELKDHSQPAALLEEQGQLMGFIEEHRAWDLSGKVEEILLRFDMLDVADRLANTLSGGEQKRLALAGLLLKQADILILDEPTNHLDVQSVEFLEEMIGSLECSVVFISHDRYFIESLAHRVVEVDGGKLTSFEGGYRNYLQKKEEIYQRLSKEHEHLLKLLKSEEEWLQRGVQARRKRNEGRKARVLQMRQMAKSNPSIISKMRLELQREKQHFNREEGVNARKMLFECENITKALGDKVLIKNLTLRVLQKDKIAIVGKNGSGKSTLLKILLGHLKPDSGTLKRGDMRIGYFDQHRAMLDEDKNLLEIFCPNGGDHIEVGNKSMHVFGYLKNFLFPKEFLDKKISYLSGGEKNRVALALLFTRKYDCLILDEPTNDLDIATINILEEYLQNFEGAILFVSHDRYFVDKIAHKLLVFRGDGLCEEIYTDYSEYLDMQKELSEYENIQKELKSTPIPTPRQKKPTKLSYKEAQELEHLPLAIERLEQHISDLEAALSDVSRYENSKITQMALELQEAKDKLEEDVARYFALEEKAQELLG